MSDEDKNCFKSASSEGLEEKNDGKTLKETVTLLTEKFLDLTREIDVKIQTAVNEKFRQAARKTKSGFGNETTKEEDYSNEYEKFDAIETSSDGRKTDDAVQNVSAMDVKSREGSCVEDPKSESKITSQDYIEKTVKSNMESFLALKLVDVKSELMKEIRNEVRSEIRNEMLHGYRSDRKSEFDTGDEEQDSDVGSDDNNQMETVIGVDESTVNKIPYWRKMAKEELKSARETDLRSSTGIHTVICLDTSESMREPKAWSQAKQFYTEYLNGLPDVSDEDKGVDKVALVIFGKDTKVCRRFTSDFESLKDEFDKLEPDGPSPMFGGLLLSKAVAETSDKRYPTADIEIWPKIILITDGRPTDVNNIDGLEESSEENVHKAKQRILNEVKRLKDARIELHIVHVGAADFEFLHKLRDCINGSILSCADAEKMAHYYLIQMFLKRKRECDKRNLEGDAGDGAKSADDTNQEKPIGMVMLEGLAEIMKHVKDMFVKSYDMYKSVDNKRYPPIGSRVRRGNDWTWGDQDGNGVGTIIGHYSKEEEPRDRQIWIWVEWDENEDANVYRYKTLKGTKSDVKIVEEDRLPPEDCPVAVGMKVISGKDYQGKTLPSQGVVIKRIDPTDSDDSVKMEVLWTDGTRGQYYFGEGGTKAEIEPRTVLDKPGKPRNLTILSSSDKAVRLEWDKPVSSGGCNILKYTVLRKSDHDDSDWLQTMDVDGNQTSVTVSVLLPKEKYKFAVRAENKKGFGMLAETEEFIMLELKVNTPQPPAGPVCFHKITKSSCTMSWKESQECAVEPVSHYLLEYREQSGTCTWNSINVGHSNSYTICKLKKSTKYEIQVKAVNEGGESEPLEIHTFVTRTLLDNDIPDAMLQATDIAQLSTGIGKNWQLLGPHFGRTNVEINHIQEDHSLGVAMQINTMLSNWKADKGADATLHKFLEGIEKFKAAVLVNWDIIEEVTRRFQSEA